MDDTGLELLDHLRLVNTVIEKLLGRFDDESLFLQAQPERCLALHAEMKILKGHVADAAREIDRLLIVSLDGERKAVVGDKVIEVRRSYKRSWDTPLLAGAVAACVLAGERLPEVDQVVEAFVKTARLEWRVTELEKLGIDSDRFCDKELGAATVSVL